ncbi:MAG: sce7726 family protein [Mycolicibacterium sp.]|uniref:sce7726 family protein n=1 Tax=Mycolicibacterium sp. TaxID=2320850 RepID=UPI003D14D794
MDDLGRQLALAFSTRCIRELAGKNTPWPRDRLAPIIDLAEVDATLGEAFDTAYARLTRDYRCEYVYANSLITAAVASRAAELNAISGLRVSMSIADLVITGEQPTVYEIKTDLDGFARLELQLHSYGTCFEHVYVVTSPAKTARTVAETPNHVGVLTLTDTGQVDVARLPSGGLDRIERSSLFRVLRRDELLAIVERQFGYVLDVPNGRIYQRLNTLFMQLDVETAYREFVIELRRRDCTKRQAALDAGLPASLQAAAAGLTLTPTAWRRLGAQLRRPADQFRAVGITAAAM